MATFNVFYGAEKPLRAVGRHQVKALQFAAQHPGWHSFAKDNTTTRAIFGLAKRGSVVVNSYGQFAIAYSQFKKD